jgi:hypothetical protein
MLAEEETPTADLDMEGVQADAGVRQPPQDLPAGTGAPTSVKDQLVAACQRARLVLAEHEIAADLIDMLDAAIARAEKGARREGTKEQALIEMLQRGTTVAEIMESMGWQRHSCFGTLANLKKRKGLNIVSEKPAEGDRVYRLV